MFLTCCGSLNPSDSKHPSSRVGSQMSTSGQLLHFMVLDTVISLAVGPCPTLAHLPCLWILYICSGDYFFLFLLALWALKCLRWCLAHVNGLFPFLLTRCVFGAAADRGLLHVKEAGRMRKTQTKGEIGGEERSLVPFT